MRTLIALVLVALFALAFAETKTQATAQAAAPLQVKSFTSKKLVCRRVRKCVAFRFKCVQYRRHQSCAQWGTRVHRFIVRYQCVNYRRFYRGHFEVDENDSAAANKAGFDRFISQKARKHYARHCSQWKPVYGKRSVPFCKRYKTVRQCAKKKLVCNKTKRVRRCYRYSRRIKVVGPKVCQKGYYLVYKYSRERRVIVRSCVRTAPDNRIVATCSSHGDPHFKTFDNIYYSLYKNGDYVLTRTKDRVFAIHARQSYSKRFPTFSLNTAYAVKINGYDVLTYDANSQNFKLNGKPFNAPFGKTFTFPNGGSARFLNKHYTQIFAPNGVQVIASNFFIGHNQYAINIHVYAPRSQLNGFGSGLCGGFTGRRVNSTKQILARGLFNRASHPAFISLPPKSWKSAAQKAAAYAFCSAAKLSRPRFHDCLFDYRAGGRRFAQLSVKLGSTQIVAANTPAPAQRG